MAVTTTASGFTSTSAVQTSVGKSGTVHVTGLSGSGIDVESLVQGLVQVEGVTVQRLTTQQTQLNSVKSAYQTLETKLQALHTSSSALNDYTLYDDKAVTSSNTSALSATVASTAATSTYDVTVVRQSTQTRLYGATGITAGTLSLTSALNSSGLSTTVTGGSDPTAGKLTINGSTTISYNLTDSLNTIMSRINASSAGVTAIYDQFTKGMVLTNSNGAGPVVVTDTEGNLASALKLTAADSPTTVAGQTAQITIAGLNGGNPIESNDDIFTETETGLTGVTLNVQGTSGSSRVVVSADGSALSSAFDSFITSYNDVLDYIAQESKVAAAGSTDKSGNFVNDTSVRTLGEQMRSILNARVSGLPDGLNYLGGLGIGTTDKTGKLSVLDGTKIDNLMKSQSGNVKSLLINLTDGIMTRFDNLVRTESAATSGMVYDKELSIDTRVAALQKTIDSKNAHLTDYETRLRASFAAMESAIATSKATINQLISEFSSSSSNN